MVDPTGSRVVDCRVFCRILIEIIMQSVTTAHSFPQSPLWRSSPPCTASKRCTANHTASCVIDCCVFCWILIGIILWSCGRYFDLELKQETHKKCQKLKGVPYNLLSCTDSSVPIPPRNSNFLLIQSTKWPNINPPYHGIHFIF